MIMTMTPVHIRRAGEDLGIVGLVIAAHTLGMFAFSPLTGFLSDRLGRVAVIVAGQVLLVVSAIMASFAGGDDRLLLVASLYLLGLGWNFGFVAAERAAHRGCAARDPRVLAGPGRCDRVDLGGRWLHCPRGPCWRPGATRCWRLLGASLVAIPVAVLLRYRTRLWWPPPDSEPAYRASGRSPAPSRTTPSCTTRPSGQGAPTRIRVAEVHGGVRAPVDAGAVDAVLVPVASHEAVRGASEEEGIRGRGNSTRRRVWLV